MRFCLPFLLDLKKSLTRNFVFISLTLIYLTLAVLNIKRSILVDGEIMRVNAFLSTRQVFNPIQSSASPYTFEAPLEPLVYFYTDKQPASYYVFVLPWTSSAKDQDKMITELNQHKPDMIFWHDSMIDNEYLSHYAPNLTRYISQHYRPINDYVEQRVD